MSQEGAKKVHVCTPAIDRFLRSDTKGQLVKVNMGIRGFERIHTNYSDATLFRISQEGAECLFDEVAAHRKVELTLAELMFVAYNNTINAANVPAEYANLTRFIEQKKPGFYIGFVDVAPAAREVIVLQRFTTSIAIMSSREHISGLVIKYSRRFPKSSAITQDKK